MLPLLGFVACENKTNYTIFSTSFIKKCLFRDISFNFSIMVLISIVSSYLSSNKLHSVHHSYFFAGVGGGGGVWFEPSTKFSKRVGLTGSQSVITGKDSGSFFKGVALFT